MYILYGCLAIGLLYYRSQYKKSDKMLQKILNNMKCPVEHTPGFKDCKECKTCAVTKESK